MRMRATIVLWAVTAPLVAAPPAGTARARWTVEKPAGQVILRLRSDPPTSVSFDRDSVALVLACDVSTRQLHARFTSRNKTYGTFAVRFDGEPAVTYGKPTDRFHDPDEAHQLVVPDAESAAFVEKVRQSRRVLLRLDHLGRFYDITFDPSGLSAVIAPLQQACGLPDAAAPARAVAAAAPRAPRQSTSGRWDIRETFSTLDDQPVVVLMAYDRPPSMTLVLRCQEKALEAFFALNTGVFDSDARTRLARFSVALDGGEAVSYDGPTTADLSTAVFLPEAGPFVKALPGRRSLALTYTPYRKTATKSTTFDLTGIDGALKPLLAACPLP